MFSGDFGTFFIENPQQINFSKLLIPKTPMTMRLVNGEARIRCLDLKFVKY
jgi:hypothetical protein